MNTVLVVEDELIIRKGIKKIVEQYEAQKLTVLTANNGLEALEIIAKEPVQLVLTDIRMPKMDGLLLCEQMNIHYPTIPIIVISGYEDFNYATQAMRFGVREYLLKPVLPADLYKAIKKLIDEWEDEGKTVSLSKYEEWMGAMEEAIWKLDRPRITEVLDQLEHALNDRNIRQDQLIVILKESLGNLQKRLQKRSFNAQLAEENSDQLNKMSRQALFEDFRAQIVEIANQLALIRGAKVRDPFEEAKEYIDTHLADEITLEEMAQRAGISPTYFSHLFKKETDETFVQYRIRKRMEKAMELMELPHYRIIDICQEVGYTDYPHFTKTFKKFSGFSPSEYRKKMGIQ